MFLLFCIYCAASLVHFVHNAEFLSAYPNLPAWLTRSEVYFSWIGVTVVGLTGLCLFRFGRRVLGLVFIAFYAALGFAGLDHYSLAPMSAHTRVMNATIWFEVASAAFLFATTVMLLLRSYGAARAMGTQGRPSEIL